MGLPLRQEKMDLESINSFIEYQQHLIALGAAGPEGQPDTCQQMRAETCNTSCVNIFDTHEIQETLLPQELKVHDNFQNFVAPPRFEQYQPIGTAVAQEQANLTSVPPTGPVQIKLEPSTTPPSPGGCSNDIKNKLKKSIVTSRKAKGKGEIGLPNLFSVKEECPLTETDVAKRERRKEQNRRAAKKCRGKKKEKQDKARQEVREALRRKDFLEKEVLSLRKYVSSLHSQLTKHVESGCCVLAQKPPMTIPDQCIEPTHPLVPGPTPAKRSRPCDNQVVPSVSPSLVTMETSPGTPYICSNRDLAVSNNRAVPDNFDNYQYPVPSQLEISPKSCNQISQCSIAHQSNISPQRECHNDVPNENIPTSNNLPSWDFNNLKPMELPGFEQISQPYQHAIDVMVSNSTTNINNNLNTSDSEATACSSMDTDSESMVHFSVSPNEVIPQVIRHGNITNRLAGDNNTKNGMSQYFIASAADGNNNNNNNNNYNNNNNNNNRAFIASTLNNNGCGYNANFSNKTIPRITMDIGSYNNYSQPGQLQQQLTSPTGLARGTNLLPDFGLSRPSS